MLAHIFARQIMFLKDPLVCCQLICYKNLLVDLCFKIKEDDEWTFFLLIFQSSQLRWRKAPPKDVRPGSGGAAPSGVKGWAQVATFEQFRMVKNNRYI